MSNIKEYDEALEDDFDYLDESSQESMANMMGELIETNNHQTLMAIELTKMVLSKNSDSTMTEDKVFDIYKKALSVVIETSPIKKLLEKV